MEFEAIGVLMSWSMEGWKSEELKLSSKEDIFGVFSPHENVIDEVRLGDDRIYSSPLCNPSEGVVAHVRDDEGDMHYICTPMLLIHTDGKIPVDFSSDALETLKKHIDFM